MNLKRKCAAEALGTAWLVLGGCGAAALAGPSLGGVGVALAFGLSLIGGIYALGHISGGHFNPAVSLGLVAAGRFPRRNLPWYLTSQILGALIGAGLIKLLTLGMPGLEEALAHVANGYGEHSPGGFGLVAALVAESVLTFFFVLVVLGATDGRAPPGFAALAIGLTLVAIHLIGIPMTNLSVNPARSTGPAAWAGGWALTELWVFWIAPLWGGYLAGKIYRMVARPL
ncbi:MAG: hypothetical protein RLZ25_956 [Pseudomonadota bacterium]|jgi:aquaporin Z